MLLVVLLLSWVCIAPTARSSCLDSLDPDIHQLQQLIAQDATQALNQAQALMNALKREPLPDGARNTARTAALYAIEAQAYGILELDADARASAAKGLALVPSERDPVHVELLLSFADSVYDSAGIAAGIQAIEAARKLQPHGSPADTCLLLNRGLLEHRQNREDLAIVTLTQAYRASTAPVVTEPHIMSADYLSIVMRSMGDYTQALALNQEKIDWDTSHGATMALSVSLFMRGQILKMMGNYDAAIGEFTKARTLSVSLADQQGIAFADQRICEVAHRTRAARVRASESAPTPCAYSAPRTRPTRSRKHRCCWRASTWGPGTPSARWRPWTRCWIKTAAICHRATWV